MGYGPGPILIGNSCMSEKKISAKLRSANEHAAAIKILHFFEQPPWSIISHT